MEEVLKIVLQIVQILVPSLALLVTVYISYQTSSNQKKVLTIQAAEKFSDNVADVAHALRKLFPERLEGAEIPAEKVYKAIAENEDTRNIVYSFLNRYESLARGVNLGVYNEEIIKFSRRKALIAAYQEFKPFIEAEREKDKYVLWPQFEKLVKKWAANS